MGLGKYAALILLVWLLPAWAVCSVWLPVRAGEVLSGPLNTQFTRAQLPSASGAKKSWQLWHPFSLLPQHPFTRWVTARSITLKPVILNASRGSFKNTKSRW